MASFAANTQKNNETFVKIPGISPIQEGQAERNLNKMFHFSKGIYSIHYNCKTLKNLHIQTKLL